MTNEELLFAVSTVWVVVAAVLVIFMQAGFAFLEAGLTRMKNVGHVAAKNVLIFALAAIVYYAVGFGMAFGDGGNGFVGGSGFFPSTDELLQIGKAPFSWFAEVPAAAAYLFQVAFAGVSLAIVWGAMAERTKLWVYFAFGIVFTLIYSLVSHWIWSPQGWLFERGMQDFAGSTVVHYQGALAGLAGALLLGPRLGRFGEDGRANAIPGHNMAFTTLGVIILWFGWFGFNAGSALEAGNSAALAFLNTFLATACAVLSWSAGEALFKGKPSMLGAASGAVAGLVAITPAAGNVGIPGAFVIGTAAGLVCLWGVNGLKHLLKVDDSLDVFGVHAIGGILGALLTGVFVSPDLGGPGFVEDWVTVKQGFSSIGAQLWVQTKAVGLTVIWTGVVSLVAFKLVDWTVGLRVAEEEEREGLDVTSHGEAAYRM